MSLQQIDVTKNSQRVAEFIRGLGRITQPMEILLEGHVVGRIVPPCELSDAEKEGILRRGHDLVQKARARSKDVPERTLGKVVDAAVKRVRAGK